MWNENILKKILKPLGKLCVDPNSEETSKGLFSRVCHVMDILKPLKMKIQFIRSSLVYDCLVDYELRPFVMDVEVKIIDLMLILSTLKHGFSSRKTTGSRSNRGPSGSYAQS